MSEKLYQGLARAMGLPLETNWGARTATATTGNNPFIPWSEASIARVRRLIPEPHRLPTPHREPDDPPGVTRCVCGVKIANFHVVYDVEDPGRNAIVGACCVLAWGRRCERCHVAHRNRRDNFCNSCRASGAYCKICPDADHVPAVTPEGLCAACEVVVAEMAAQAIAAKERAAKLRASGVCTKCGATRVRPPYEVCYTCKFSGACGTCGRPCESKYSTCWGCKQRQRIGDLYAE